MMIVFDSLIHRIPESHLPTWLWWLTSLTAIAPAVLAIAALRVSDRIGDLKTEAEAVKTRHAEHQEAIAEKERDDLKTTLATTAADAAETKNKYDLLRHKTAEMEEQLSPRKLTPKQHADLVERLTQLGAHPITISVRNADSESLAFANDILRVFREARWTTAERPAMSVVPISLVGLWLAVHNEETAPAYGIAVQSQFKACGIELYATPNAGVPPGGLEIHVGRKPTKHDPLPTPAK